MISWMYIDLHVKYLLFLPYSNKTWIYSTDFWKYAQMSNFRKIRLEGARLFHADGQTDRRDEASSYFAQICERA
jgi:hypothetical protein